ncbi:MAG: hypothetical protein OEW75_03515, partial [Cyclobacteriaceae bacterium]|nr:hypothetical protein [Cyclobacteriaceae bacterium]
AEKDNYQYLTIHTNPDQVVQANTQLEAIWKDLFPNLLYTGEYLNVEKSNIAMINNNIVKMFSFLGAIAVILAISGLYTLVSLNIIKRMKEIAVRKVLGATVSNVAIKLNLPFILILTISSVLGSALSYVLVIGLFESVWVYHVDLGIFVFIGSSLLLVLAAVFTVGIKVISAANSNPATTLRSE